MDTDTCFSYNVLCHWDYPFDIFNHSGMWAFFPCKHIWTQSRFVSFWCGWREYVGSKGESHVGVEGKKLMLEGTAFMQVAENMKSLRNCNKCITICWDKRRQNDSRLRGDTRVHVMTFVSVFHHCDKIPEIINL
jgi:hypothetical protein